MAGMKLTIVNSAEVALVAATAKTVIQYKAATVTPILFRGGTISFDGVTATDAPVVVSLVRTAGDGTGTTIATPSNENEAVTYSAQGTAKENFSVEPATVKSLAAWEIHPQGGGVVYELSITEPILCTTAVALKCTAPANVNCIAFLKIEE